MIRVHGVVCDIEEKLELFRVGISEDKDFSGIENDLFFRPKRKIVTKFPDDLNLHNFFSRGISSAEPIISEEIINSTKYKVHSRMELINNAGARLMIEASDDIPMNLNISLE